MQFGIVRIRELYANSPDSITAYKRDTRSYLRSQWWSIHHDTLTDDSIGKMSFRAHYRVTRKTFEWIVNEFKEYEEYLGSQSRNGIPVYIQVAAVLWRFANTHFGYRLSESFLGIKAGSYHALTKRFVSAMKKLGERNIIAWPSDDSDRSRQLAREFGALCCNNGIVLKNAIGALDGKLFVIRKPSIMGNAYVDRKNHPSLQLLAVCDAYCRFMYIGAGESSTLHFSCLCQYYHVQILMHGFIEFTGRVHDSRAFRQSKLYEQMLSSTRRTCPNGS